jgi:hypothetical protein
MTKSIRVLDAVDMKVMDYVSQHPATSLSKAYLGLRSKYTMGDVEERLLSLADGGFLKSRIIDGVMIYHITSKGEEKLSTLAAHGLNETRD